MSIQWKKHLQSPQTDMNEFFLELGGYEGLKKIQTSLVQIGAVQYDLEKKQVIQTLNLNVKHDYKTAKWNPDQDTYSYAEFLTGVRFDEVKDAVPLQEAASRFRDFLGDRKWIVMNNDYQVIKSQLPEFASDRKEPIRLKPLLMSSKICLNSG